METAGGCGARRGGFEGGEIISHEVLLTLFFKRQFSHKSVNSFFVLVTVKDKLTDLWGS